MQRHSGGGVFCWLPDLSETVVYGNFAPYCARSSEPQSRGTCYMMEINSTWLSLTAFAKCQALAPGTCGSGPLASCAAEARSTVSLCDLLLPTPSHV